MQGRESPRNLRRSYKKGNLPKGNILKRELKKGKLNSK
jgi:hypothetical protein